MACHLGLRPGHDLERFVGNARMVGRRASGTAAVARRAWTRGPATRESASSPHPRLSSGSYMSGCWTPLFEIVHDDPTGNSAEEGERP